ncbi:fimbria major subunit [Phocaeicola sp.]
MKIKGLLLGMFACAALVACTNDDIVENNGENQPEQVKANLTLIIGTTTDSSRASSENSDSEDVGTEAESKVNEALIVLNYIGTKGGALSTTEIVKTFTGSELKQATVAGSPVYMPTFDLAQSGWYKVLVVLNPNSAIKGLARNAGAYQAICDYEYSYAGTGTNEMTGTTDAPSFMMVNQSEAEVNVVSNDYTHPSTKEIAVERVASKISFIPNTTITDHPNRYELEVTTADYVVSETLKGYYVSEDGVAHEVTGLNKATTVDGGETIYVQNGERAFKNTGETYAGTGLPIFELLAEVPAFKYDYTKSNGKQTWYVQLDDYALVNLSNSVFAVRHLANADFTETKNFGLIDASYPYIMDPKTSAKNAVDKTAINGTPYFYNVAAAVKTAQIEYAATADKTEYNKYFHALPGTTDAENATIGAPLAYCLENVVKVDNQVAGLVTGIIFRGQICNVNGEPMGTIYKWGGKYYTDLEQIFADSGSRDTEPDAKYDGGKCYYYSSDIMHFATDDYMKKAIMRNNVYVLKIDGFKGIGSATVDIPDGDETQDPNFYLKLTSTILKWKVRLNNITLE